MVAARLIAAPRSLVLFELASTRMIPHCGQVADTMSRSREISLAQPESGAG